MSSREDPSKISTDSIIPKGTPEEKTIPDQSQFQAFMDKSPVAKEEEAPPEGVSPMELAKGASFQTAGPSVQNLLGQVNAAEGNLADIQEKLQTPNLKFKRQHQYLLRNKLSDANNHLRGAGNRLGANLPDPAKVPGNANPIEKFLGYVTDGQNQINATKAKLQQISASSKQLNPAELLLVQIKLSQAQQELEYSSILLSKVVDIFKQMMNIQL